jgi:flagellar P-ring protein precursor FlgI
MKLLRILLFTFLAAAIVAGTPRSAEAKVRLDSFCSIYGMYEVQLVGMGIVTGLNGTGDSAKNAPTMRRLAQVMRLMNAPAQDLRELRNVKNVALVQIHAVIPRQGIRYGQKLDCYVTSIMDAKSLRGGRLLATPLEESNPGKLPPTGKRSAVAFGIASGHIMVEDQKQPTVGRISGGLMATKDVINRIISKGNYITILINRNLSSAYTANEVARAINQDFEVESSTPIAKAVSPNSVRVMVPASYRKSPFEFVGQVMSVGVEQPHVQARVVVNSKNNTIVVTGEVEVSPVMVSIAGLQIDTQGLGTSSGGGTRDSFVGIPDRRNVQSTKSLEDLIKAFRDLKVPPEDIIKVLRMLNRSGKLYAEFIEE